MSAISVTGSSGGGMVEIDLNGMIEVLAVRIAPEAANPEETEMLQDLVVAAFANGTEKIRERIAQEIGAVNGGLSIPGFPFPGPGFPGFPGPR
jgi:DNA-binding YbaB/EbfC family protein